MKVKGYMYPQMKKPVGMLHPCVYDFCFFYNTAEVVCVFLLNRIKENAFLMYVEKYFIILKQ
jgi:hypothetical protein